MNDTRRGNIHECYPYDWPEPLRRGERTAYDQDRGKTWRFLSSSPWTAQPEGNDHGCDRKDAPDHRVEIALVQRGHRRERVHGVPMAPHATGEVLAIRLRAAAWNGLKPSPIMKAPAMATRRRTRRSLQ